MESTITDWIESIGTATAAIAAIVAVIFGILAYKKDRSSIQHQIDSLKLLAEHQATENELSRKQILLNQQLIEIHDKERKSNIKPLLKSAGGGGNMNVYTIDLKNHGETAYNLNISELKNEKNIIVVKQAAREVSKNEQFGIVLRRDKENVMDSILKLEITYDDADNNKYSQIIENKGQGAIIHPAKIL